MKSVFIAAPFTDHFTYGNDKENSSQRLKRFIESIYDLFFTIGYNVYCSHIREKWGKAVMPPEKCTPLDFELIKKSDILIAIPGNPASGGVHLELGWASVLGKRIILLLEKKGEYSPLVYGLDKITSVETICYNDQSDVLDKLKPKLKGGLNDV